MSYEDDDEGGGGGHRGRLVPVATFFTVHEAELARTRLVAEGFLAFVWDGSTVAVNPLLAVAVHGVKVVVPEKDAPRARLVLGPLAEVFGGAPRPVFRVKATRAAEGLISGGAVGLVAGLGLGRVAGSDPRWMLAAVVLGAVGHVVGSRRRGDFCSGCRKALPLSATECPGCGGLLRGTIPTAEARLAAEEALPDAPVEGASPDEG